MQYRVTVNGKTYDVVVEKTDGSSVAAPSTQVAAPVTEPAGSAVAPTPAPVAPAKTPAPVSSSAAGSTVVESPMPGKILRVSVAKGDVVKSGQVIMILEAMKMENEIPAPADGTISDINVSEGSAVNSGDVLAVIS